MIKDFIEVDVREDLALKREPFDKIMGAVKELGEDQYLVLHAPFNPIPLHTVLKRRGLIGHPEKIERKHWRVEYHREELEKE